MKDGVHTLSPEYHHAPGAVRGSAAFSPGTVRAPGAASSSGTT